MGKSTHERFEEKYLINKKKGCWEWQAAKGKKGYGAFGVGRKVLRSHRYSYEYYKGEIPKGMCVMHICNNPTCCNPDHLKLGTPLHNMQHRDASGHGKSRWDTYRADYPEPQTNWQYTFESLTERIKRNVEIDGNGCWNWNLATTKRGYGRIAISGNGKKRHRSVHRVSYEAFNGSIPDGLVVRHKCDNPSCCNPDHLELGTTADNLQDMVKRGRSLFGEKNPDSKLTERDVLLIREMLDRHPNKNGSRNGIGTFLARWFPVNNRSINNIKNRTTWSHI